jgi:signal transduction histidine kinase
VLLERYGIWFRLPLWAALSAYTAYTAPSLFSQLLAGTTMAAAAVTLQFVRVPNRDVRIAMLVLSTLLAYVATFAAHDGAAEVLVAVAAARLPYTFEGRSLNVLSGVDAVAFAVTIGYITGTPVGALAGLGIPALVQRSVEHRELVRERDRAQALLAEVQRAREADEQAAALRERGRIAREMHDVLAHTLAGLSLQLQAVRAVATREAAPRTVVEPLERAAELARDGLAEARAAVGALQAPAGLGVDALPALIGRHPGNAHLTVSGTPGALADDAGHAVYRAVQEALTNAARYAPGSAVEVRLEWLPERLCVEVVDTGPAPDRAPVAGQGNGLGLPGMTERLRQAGGTVTAGPRGPGGWQVRLNVPLAVTQAPA